MSDAEAELRILEERARALARPRVREAVAEKYALFERGGIRYAIEPRFVFAVARAVEPTPIPNAAPYWCGVSSVQGELLALIDLPVLLADGEPQRSGDDPSEAEAADPRGRLVLVLGLERHELGLVIDALHEATVLPLDLAHAHTGDTATQLIIGSTQDGTRVVRAEALLSDPRLFMQANHSIEK